jgi:hypothetical protein
MFNHASRTAEAAQETRMSVGMDQRRGSLPNARPEMHRTLAG